MGYKIDYPTTHQTPDFRGRGFVGVVISVTAAILCALMVNVCFPQAKGFLRSILFPEGTAVTVSALEEMVWDLKNGQTFRQSFLDFCQQVIRL